jgi:shikimate dehydrogenase
MHRAAFSFFQLNGSYELIDIEPQNLEAGISDLKEAGFSGFNITIPHKENVFALIPSRSPEAALVGAANTVRIDSSGKLTAHNTDLGGFIAALQLAMNAHHMNSAGLKNVLVLGAGGVARACLAALLLLNCAELNVAARRPAEAEKFTAALKQNLQTGNLASTARLKILSLDETDQCHDLQLLVNCTSIGLGQSENEKLAWAEKLFAKLPGDCLFFDTVYRRDRQATTLMQIAEAHNIASADGLDMLVAQAALAFEYWTGKLPEHSLMRQALNLPSYQSAGA